MRKIVLCLPQSFVRILPHHREMALVQQDPHIFVFFLHPSYDCHRFVGRANTHQVYTGVTLVFSNGGAPVIRSFYEKTDVTFYPIDRADLLAYADSKDPLDKAGAYGIQGPFAIHVKKIHGDYNNVVGLPIARLYQELKTFPD